MMRIEPFQAEDGQFPVEQIEPAEINAVARASSRGAGRKVTEALLAVALEQSGAQGGLLLALRGDQLRVDAEVRAFGTAAEVLTGARPLEEPESILRHAIRTAGEVLEAACLEPNPYDGDDYIRRNGCRAVACLPLISQAALVGLLYLENQLVPRRFGAAQLALLRLLAAQLAIVLDNAQPRAELRDVRANLVESQELTHAGHYACNVDTGQILSISDEVYRIFDLDPAVWPSLKDILQRVHPDDLPIIAQHTERASRNGGLADFEQRLRFADGAIKTVHVVRRAVPGRAGEVIFRGTVRDVSAFKRTQEKLHAASIEMQKLVSLIENSTDCIGYARSTEHVDYVNAAWRRMVGLEPGEDLSQYRMSDFLAEEGYRYFLEEMMSVLARDGHWAGERALRHVNNHQVIPVHQTIFFITEPGTSRRGEIATICRDITERKRMDEKLRASLTEKEALFTEGHHRVKNNLQLMSSLLSLEEARSTSADIAERFAESRNRLRAMALVHENLYHARNSSRIAMAEHIEPLCAHLLRAYRGQVQQVELSSAVANVELDLDVAVSVGLIVNELVSNALKHAFPDGRRGSIHVQLRSLAGTLHELTVRDDGIGLGPTAIGDDSESLGLQLVHDLTRQLGGEVQMDRRHGTSFSIAFDAEQRAGSAR